MGGARAEGIYAGKPRSFCLPRDEARQNLFRPIAGPAIEFFTRLGIKWHHGCPGGLPSNHLCDSQVCCVNFLFPFTSRPEALRRLLTPAFEGISAVLPMECSGEYLTFEWIGLRNYLCERVARSGKRTRGANCTSADAAVLLENRSGAKHIVLIEWKYTESYPPTSLRFSRSGTDRTRIYSHLWHRDDFPLKKDLMPDFASLFHEPFYQLFRLQCLAHEMEKAGELGAERVSVLHICPRANRDFARVTSPGLAGLGASVSEVWRNLVRDPSRFASVATEDLFGGFPARLPDDLGPWWAYLTQRYRWLSADATTPPD